LTPQEFVFRNLPKTVLYIMLVLVVNVFIVQWYTFRSLLWYTYMVFTGKNEQTTYVRQVQI